MSRTLVIANPNAGKLKNKNRLNNLINAIKSQRINVDVFFTKKRLDATNYIQQHGKEFSLVIAIGGDGTLNEVISGLLISNQNIPIGYIAAGTANDFAKTHQLLLKDTKMIDLIFNHPAKPIDIGLFNQRYFSYVAAFGAYTAVAIKTNQKLKNWIGYQAYLLESFRHLSTLKKYNITLMLDGLKTQESVIFFAMFHATSVGGLLNFKPHQVDLHDGYLDVCYIRYPKNIIEAMAIIVALANRSYRHPSIVLTKAKNIQVLSNTPLEWSLDGEDGGQLNSVKATCLKDAIKIVTPII